MAFIKREVKDRVVQYPRRYQLVEVQPGIFDFIPVTGTITEPGTAINKAYLQPIEEAIEDIEDGTTVVQSAYNANNAVIAERATRLDAARKINGVNFDATQDITIADSTKAPISHANSGNTYGLGSPTLHGHVKTINNLTQASHIDGTALSAYMGKALKDLINSTVVSGTYTGNGVATRTIPLDFTPKAVIVTSNSGTIGAYPAYGGIAVNGSPFKGGYQNASNTVEIITNGFSVFLNTSNGVKTNENNIIYNYIAFS